MRKLNKVLVLIVLLATTLLLTSCSGNKNAKNTAPQFSIINETSGELFADFETTKLVKSVKNLKIWTVLYNGTIELEDASVLAESEAKVTYEFADGKITNANGFVIENGQETSTQLDVKDANVKLYEYQIASVADVNYAETVVYRQYNKNKSGLLGYAVDFVNLNDKGEAANNALVLTTSYEYTGNNISIYEVKGEKATLVDNVPKTVEGFPERDDLIVDKSYVNYVNFPLTLNINNEGITREISYKVRIAATNEPINSKTSSFWNWIFLQTPLAYLMSFIAKITGGSFAVAILITTLIVRTLAWPIYAKTNDMSMKMSVAQPDLDRLQRKYAARKDPESQQRMQMEMMQIYKKHKINMFGCLLPFLQMPIFLAMYQVVNRITIPGGEFAHFFHNTRLLGTDLASGGTVARIVFTVLVGATMILLQKISQIKPSYVKNMPQKAQNEKAMQTEKTMKMMSYMMVAMMIVTSYVSPGLALSYYWIIGNIYAIGQTITNRKLNEIKYQKLQDEKLYGKSRQVVDAEFKKKGEK
ncbi:MAG: YidC/Oxa1 family membrane protein insertase [Acholeplasma sp.]|nr:YidC/Oxa1 family membrane protein insertase [Acholeplasma sp.]